jgi:hypothetical protein
MVVGAAGGRPNPEKSTIFGRPKNHVLKTQVQGQGVGWVNGGFRIPGGHPPPQTLNNLSLFGEVRTMAFKDFR